jgi:DNA polymerase (family 10)
MPVHNADIADMFNRMADLLEIQGANPFRVRAYRNAARTVGELSRSAADMVREGEDLSRLAGIGKDLAGKIAEIVETGKLRDLEKLKGEIPEDLSVLMRVAGLGPKRVLVLHRELGVSGLGELEKAAKDNKIRELPGFGGKTEENILEEIARQKEAGERVKLMVADEIAKSLVGYLEKTEGVKDIVVSGSYRRRKETVGDLDILVTCGKGSGVMDRFAGDEDVDRVLSKGETRSSVLLRSGLKVDLRVVPEESYGAALHYFTGSKAHNIAVRKMGVRKGLKINEYGVFRGEGRVAGRTEEEVYGEVGLPYIEPELREDRGEIEAAREKRLPRLISPGDIRGDLHVHTRLTDGRASLEEMALAAKERGYEYLAVTEHSKHVTIARGLDEKALGKQIREIDRLNEELPGIVLLKGIELDVLEDGSLDLSDDILRELDLVVCSVHYKFNLSMQKQTGRIIRAMDNPYVNIFSHPTGRLINERAAYEVDMERLMEAAKERGCFFELNAHPDRLDLTDVHCKMAREMGLKVAISTDAHSVNGLGYMRFGLWQARRGWLEADDVLNTRKWKDLKKLLKRK